MNNETVKQDSTDVARDDMGSFFCLAFCGNAVSAKLRIYRAGVYRGYSSNMDNAYVQRHLKLTLQVPSE